MNSKIEISRKTVIFAVLIIAGIWFLSRIIDIVFMLFISVILMSALKPIVDRLERFHLHRGMSILVVYIILWTSIGFIVAGIIPGLVDQTTRLIRVLPAAISKIDFFTNHQQDITRELLSYIGSLPQGFLKATFGIFGNLLNVLTTIVITFYLLLERNNLSKYLTFLLNGEPPLRITRIIDRIEKRLGDWVRGELILMLVIGILTYVGLSLLGIDIALPLAIIAGILEIVPNIGPIVSAIPAVLIAITINPILGLATSALYFLVHFLENHLITPKIMQKAVGINPVISIVSLLIGFKLAGPIGTVLAIPVIIVVQSIGQDYFKRPENKENQAV
jgi:predicted PurR-regulated permease PerM